MHSTRLIVVALLAACAATAAAAALRLGHGAEPLGAERAAQLLGRWDLANLNPENAAPLTADDQAFSIPVAAVTAQIASMAANGAIPADNVAAADALLAGVVGQLEPRTRELHAIVVVSANPATGLVFAYHIYQNAGQPLTVAPSLGIASVLPSGEVLYAGRMASTHDVQVVFQGAAGTAAAGVISGSAASSDGTEASFYASNYVRSKDNLATVLPQLAKWLAEAGLTLPADGTASLTAPGGVDSAGNSGAAQFRSMPL